MKKMIIAVFIVLIMISIFLFLKLKIQGVPYEILITNEEKLKENTFEDEFPIKRHNQFKVIGNDTLIDIFDHQQVGGETFNIQKVLIKNNTAYIYYKLPYCGDTEGGIFCSGRTYSRIKIDKVVNDVEWIVLGEDEYVVGNSVKTKKKEIEKEKVENVEPLVIEKVK